MILKIQSRARALGLFMAGSCLGLWTGQALASSAPSHNEPDELPALFAEPAKALGFQEQPAVSELAAARSLTNAPGSFLMSKQGRANHLFGASLDRSGDTVVIGAPGAFDREGMVYVSKRSGRGWSTPQELTVPAEQGDEAGWSVAIDGDYIAVGSPLIAEPDQGQSEQLSEVGAVTFLERRGELWIPRGKIYSSKRSEGGGFGFDVDLLGDLAIIGEPGFDDAAQNKRDVGAAYIARRDAQGRWVQAQVLQAPGVKQASDVFGIRVALSRSGTQTFAFVSALGRDDKGRQSGAVYVFERSGSSAGAQFRHVQTLVAADGAAADQFGFSLAAQGRRVVVGAPRADVDGVADAGAAYLFDLSFGSWVQRAKLRAKNGVSGALLGSAVALDGDRVAVGSNAARGASGGSASVVMYERESAQQYALYERYELPSQAGRLLASLHLQGESLLAGASQGQGQGGALAGRVQVIDTAPQPAPLGAPWVLGVLGLGLCALGRRDPRRGLVG